jgi:hypothetical protein
MNEYLMFVCGVLPDAFNAKLQVIEIVPSRNQDGEKRRFVLFL